VDNVDGDSRYAVKTGERSRLLLLSLSPSPLVVVFKDDDDDCCCWTWYFCSGCRSGDPLSILFDVEVEVAVDDDADDILCNCLIIDEEEDDGARGR